MKKMIKILCNSVEDLFNTYLFTKKSTIVGPAYIPTDSSGNVLSIKQEFSPNQDTRFNLSDTVSQNYDPEWIHYTRSSEWTCSKKRGFPLKRGYPFPGI